MKKIIHLGTINGIGSVFCKIECNDGRLSITGVEGPMRNGDARGACGQIVMHLNAEDIKPAPGWTRNMIREFLSRWDRWHLNDMRAGSAVQEDWLRANPLSEDERHNYFVVASERLRAAGINPDPQGYFYGHAWNREEVPADVIAWFQALPDTDEQPAWI